MLDASRAPTIRELMERIRDRNSPLKRGSPWAGRSMKDYHDAVAALALMDEAVQVAIVGKGSDSTSEDWRCIYDPDPQDAP